MIDANKLTDEISRNLLKVDSDESLRKPQIDRIKKRNTFLKMCKQYLESGPTEEFLTKEFDRINNRISLFNSEYESWIPNKQFETENEKLKEYQKEMGIPKLKLQRDAIRFILNN